MQDLRTAVLALVSCAVDGALTEEEAGRARPKIYGMNDHKSLIAQSAPTLLTHMACKEEKRPQWR